MRICRPLVLLLIAFVATNALAQLTIPNIVQLPSSDFVWNWGRPLRPDDFERPEFEVFGVEEKFNCTVTGAFRPSSRMSDFYNLRDFEQELSSTLRFIQHATYRLNDLYRSRDLQWAKLDCFVPDFEATEEETQEKVDRALERARRAQERRRARDDDQDD